MSPLAIALAGIVGAGLGIIFAPKSGEKTREEIAHRAENLAEKFKKSKRDIQHALMKVFGKVSDELEKDYVQIRANVVAEIDALHSKKKFTKERYDTLVEKAIKAYAKGKDWTRESIEDLRRHFEDEWQDMKNSLES